MKMIEVGGKEIKDECSHCGNILECELFRQGHGIKQWKPKERKYKKGVLRLFSELATSPMKGACLEYDK